MNATYIGEMSPRFDGRKSYYGKARLFEQDNVIILVSYSTEVMHYDKTTDTFTRLVGQPQSATTNRHMGEFARQMNGSIMGKRDLCKLDTFSVESLPHLALVSGTFSTSDNWYFGSTWKTPDIDY